MALVGALRRVNDKDISLKALEAENQAAMHLVGTTDLLSKGSLVFTIFDEFLSPDFVTHS